MNQEGLFQRITELLHPQIFENKKVVVIGVGSGGSHIILELVRCGVSNIVLIDKDTLSLHNVIRHICGIRDIGRLKTEAVKDYLLNINPNSRIACHQLDVMKEEDELQSLINGASLVIAGTDNEPSRFRINRLCWSLGIPALYAYAFYRAFYGEAFLVIPQKTPCYACFSSRLGHIEPEPEDKGINYDDPNLSSQERSMPGLGMDITMIALLAAKLGLIFLLEDTPYKMDFPPGNCVRWKNRPLSGEASNEYFDRQFWQVEGYPGCMVCGNKPSKENMSGEFDRIMSSL